MNNLLDLIKKATQYIHKLHSDKNNHPSLSDLCCLTSFILAIFVTLIHLYMFYRYQVLWPDYNNFLMIFGGGGMALKGVKRMTTTGGGELG